MSLFPKHCRTIRRFLAARSFCLPHPLGRVLAAAFIFCSVLPSFDEWAISSSRFPMGRCPAFTTPLFAADNTLARASNWGMTGLMETPTARIMKENTYRLGVGQTHPYRWYYGTLGLFPRLEVGGRVTEVLGVGALSSGYGNTKDKAIDFKHQFWPEGKYSPAIAVGIMDPHGTRLYAGQYLVASKEIYPFDFSFGFGNGRFGDRPLKKGANDLFNAEILTNPSRWARDARPFWGIGFSPSEKYSFMVEYNPTQYHRQTGDPAQPKYFTRRVPSPFNFGFRWRPLKWAEIDLTYQRGDQVGINLSTTFEIGNPIVPIYDKPYLETPRAAALDPAERLAIALAGQGFSDIGVRQEANVLLIRAQNDKYFYTMRAIGVILKTVPLYRDPSVQAVRIVLTQTGIPLVEITATREDIAELNAERLTPGEFLYLSRMNTKIAKAPAIRTKGKKRFTPDWKPSFQTLLNDPSGYFKYRLGVEGSLAYHPWKGASLLSGLEVYPLNNISSSNIPPAEAVRSDIAEYKKESLVLGRLMIDQVNKHGGNLYSRFSAGYLETEYAGLDGEIAMPLANGRIFVGLQGSIVKKRDPDNPFGLKAHNVKDYYHVEFLNLRLNIPEKDMALDLKTGRFLGGDFGSRIMLTKHIKGVDLFAWYTVTDTSGFKDPNNRGYQDKGIGVSIPMRLFEGRDTKRSYNFALAPWTRDTGQDLDRYQSLFDYMGRDTQGFFRHDRKMLE